MASASQGQVSAVQVGSYFLGQYYPFLQQTPNLVHQFYTDASTMVRQDGDTNETASGMEEIHNLIISLNFTEIEIKTAHSLESLEGGIVVMVTGLVQAKDFISRRKFVETFFLAPQEKGFFVLNDIFLLEEEEVLQHPVETVVVDDDYDTNLDTLNPVEEPVSSYMPGEDIPTEDFMSPPLPADDDNSENDFSISEQPIEAPVLEESVDDIHTELPICSFSSLPNAVQDLPSVVEEPAGDPPKHTYASVLRTAKAQAASHLISTNKAAPVMSEWHLAPPVTQPQVQPITSHVQDKPRSEAFVGVSSFEDEGEKSVYVGNLPASISTFDIEQEFRNFGTIKPDGVTIRSRKEAGFFYAFIEFENADGVQNALKASPVQLNGKLIHVEGRRANGGSSRGGRRSRGRGGYNSETLRGRSGGRFSGRGGSSENDNYGIGKGNGYSHGVSR